MQRSTGNFIAAFLSELPGRLSPAKNLGHTRCPPGTVETGERTSSLLIVNQDPRSVRYVWAAISLLNLLCCCLGWFIRTEGTTNTPASAASGT
jgi:hypothetical protein